MRSFKTTSESAFHAMVYFLITKGVTFTSDTDVNAHGGIVSYHIEFTGGY